MTDARLRLATLGLAAVFAVVAAAADVTTGSEILGEFAHQTAHERGK